MDKFIAVLLVALPYVALAIFIIGTIYRYRHQGYKISSLSTQLFESKMLYWGSHAFHIGIVVLFLGHLIGFLMPASLLAWGGVPARIITIEIAAFAFALLCLSGLSILVFRRLTVTRLTKLTSPMDVVVYLLLVIQLIIGISVALFYKYGSLWFASSLAPYLKSIFFFSPDIQAIEAMPLLIQLHAALAFIIVALIPFSRLMHILVYPFVFIGRPALVFIWNRDRKTHRGSRKMFQGMLPKKN